MNKAPDAFRTISEVADELDLPQHVLRFWESRFPQIKPMKRGGGRRYYRPDDVDLLRGIRHLLYGEGYTIRGVQRILREQGARFVQLVWQEGAPQPPAHVAEDLEVEAHEEREPERARGLLSLLPPLFSSDGEARPRAEPTLEAAPAGAQAARLAPTAEDSPVRPARGLDKPDARDRGAPIAAGLPAAQIERLQAALRDLDDCKRLLDAALDVT